MKEAIDDSLLFPSDSELEFLKNSAEKAVRVLKEGLKKYKLDADVFVGGSFAKGTIMKSSEYDIDIFVRFSLKYNNISELLEKIMDYAEKKLGKRCVKVHGSRDYFQILWAKNATFEIIPVNRITNPKEEKNVTDLSYFHVGYVKSKFKNKKLQRELFLAKKFCKANGFYGAESYISGFSGYALECLILYYKSFEKMLKEITKIKDERIVIDMRNNYKTKRSVFIELNESKTQGPIILIDPTWKERNALAALSWDSLRKFQQIAKEYLKSRNKKYFEEKRFSKKSLEEYAKKNKAELICIEIKTNRQQGDIAGTKLKKFSAYLERQLSRYFEIAKSEFSYSLGQSALAYYIVKSKKEVVREGPPLNLKKQLDKFVKRNKNVFYKKGRAYAKDKVNFSGRDFIKKWKSKNKDVAEGMGITELSF